MFCQNVHTDLRESGESAAVTTSSLTPYAILRSLSYPERYSETTNKGQKTN